MDYREFAPPDRLRRLVRVAWTLDVGAAEAEWVRHVATPDGCVEVIRRLAGRSSWKGEQPACFVAGLIDRPVQLRLGAGARFVAIRLWPWAWNRIGAVPVRDFLGQWRPLDDRALPDTVEAALEALPEEALDPATSALGEAIVASRSVADLSARSGRSPRWLQRWFEREIGLPPRTYLRLIRFQESFRGLPAAHNLAEHAADHGYADQSHMARDYRSLTGGSASAARSRARPPFL